MPGKHHRRSEKERFLLTLSTFGLFVFTSSFSASEREREREERETERGYRKLTFQCFIGVGAKKHGSQKQQLYIVYLTEYIRHNTRLG
jgi:hypothetical protein